MTTTEEQATDTASTDASAPRPLRLTYDAFCELDVCEDYLRRHRLHYPVSQYPNGPELTEEELARHPEEWNWDWAETYLLTEWGADEYRRIRSSRAQEYRRFGTGIERRARVMGYLLHHHPDARSQRLKDACVTNVERQARRQLNELDQLDGQLRHARGVVQTRQARLREAEAEVTRLDTQVTELRAVIAPALRLRAQERAARAVRAVEVEERRAAARLAELRAEAERVAAELTQLDEQATPSTTGDAG